MFSGLDDWLFSADIAEVIDEFSRGIEEFLTLITLVSSGLDILAMRADSDDEPIGQKEVAVFAVALGHFFLGDSSCLLDI